MKEGQIIRDCAARGWSRSHVASHLGLSLAKFKAVLEGMPEVKWGDPRHSLLSKERYESQRGQPFPVTHEQRMRGAESVRERHRVHSICGIRGTIRELLEVWSEYVTVDRETVRRRLSRGRGDPDFCIYDAFFTPPAPHNQRRNKNWSKHAKQQP